MKTKVTSWGNTSKKTVEILDDFYSNSSPVVACGNNNSYGDVAFSASNYAIKYKKNNKTLLTVNQTIEDYITNTKVSLFGIPGKRNVTLAGAVASDVHGKDNLWGGSFIKNIDQITLKTSSGKLIKASREKNSEIFYSTVGGYGLTGIIIDIKMVNNKLSLHKEYFSKINIGEGLDNLFSNFEYEDSCYWVAWIDLSNRKYRWYSEKSKPLNTQKNREVKKKTEKEFSSSLPFIGMNKYNSLGFMNKAFLLSKGIRKNTVKSHEDVNYPLNEISNTKNFAKNRKIIQIQFSIPLENSDKIQKLIDLLCTKNNVILCSVKRLSSNESNHNLSFVQDGWTLALDFAYETFNYSNIREFYDLICKYNGLVYLAKDSTLNQDEFKRMYTNYNDWKVVLKSLDPKNDFQSELSKRLGLKEW